MEHAGRSYVFDYGALAIRVRYLSGEELEWELIRGPQAGSKGTERYGFALVRPGVSFF